MSAEAVTMMPPALSRPREDRLYRIMPHNAEVEQALLGALLVNNRAFEKVSEYLRPEHFYAAVHGRLFDAIAKYIERGQDASPMTLKPFFEKDTDLQQLGGGQYLVDLAASVVSVANVEDYGRTVYDLHLRRALIALGEEVVNEAYDPPVESTATGQIDHAEKRLFDLATAGDFRGGFVSFQDGLKRAIELAHLAYAREGSITGVTSGLVDLDKMMGGLQPSDLVILAGRPSMGKSALAATIAFNAAKSHVDSGRKEGAVAGFFSLEMSTEQLITRILAEQTRVPSNKIRMGEVKDTDFHKFVEASHQLSQLPLFFDDTPALTLSAIRTRARRLKRKHNLGLLVIDYLQLIQGSGRGGIENRVQEVSEITRGLKAIAKELNVPVLALSQLSRAVESRDNKRPMLSDLRESGSIEQDADVVMFVYRDEYYLEREEPKQRPEEKSDAFASRYQAWQESMEKAHNVAECIIAKQRHGPIGTIKLLFEGEFTRFADLANYTVEQHD